MSSTPYAHDSRVELISFEQFAIAAEIRPLVNHGRTAEVFFRGVSRGFTDALGTAGLRQAHRVAVNTGPYCVEGDEVPECLHRAMLSKEALKYHPEMEMKIPFAYARVKGSQQSALAL